MAQENVEVVRRSIEVWNEGAYSVWTDMHHRDVVIVPPEEWPEVSVSEDRDAWFAQAMRLTDSWVEQRIELDELREVGDRVLAIFRWVTRGKGSGIELETHMSLVATVRDGKIGHAEYFVGRDKALEAVGLSD